MTKHMGNMTVTAENAVGFPPIEQFYGHLTIAKGAHLVAPNLQMIRGWLTMLPGARLEAMSLGEIKGWLTVGEDCQVDAPNLRHVERDAAISTDAFHGGLLAVGSLRISGNVQMDELTHISGNLALGVDAVGRFPHLQTVSGSITLKPGAQLWTPDLKHIGGFYDADESAVLVAPAFLAS